MPNLEHTRKMPAEWPELIARAEKITDQGSRRPYPWRVHGLSRAACKLSGFVLEENYYYSLGKPMCNIAQKLQDPEIRGEFIQKSAVGIVKAAMRKRDIPLDKPFVPIIRDLRPKPMQKAAKPIIRNSFTSLSYSEQTLANSLLTATTYCRVLKETPRASPDRLIPYVLSAVVGQFPQVPLVIKKGMFEGSIDTISHLLINPQDERGTNAPIDLEKLSEIRKPGNFTQPARLSLNEFLAGHGWVQGEASFRFDKSVLRDPPLELAGKSLRTERLGCEALFAGGLAVDVGMNLVPEVIMAASQIVPNDLASK